MSSGSRSTSGGWTRRRRSRSRCEYRQRVAEIRAQIAILPGSDNRLILFDKYRDEVRAFAEMVDSASSDKLQELIPWLIERVETHDSRVRIVSTPGGAPLLRVG